MGNVDGDEGDETNKMAGSKFVSRSLIATPRQKNGKMWINDSGSI